ncbi:MAG: serine/threonine-protein kinase [Myxococcota bacterium]|nr:serine/threonine-protein kinase [Myxococcota bacterium]
METQRATDIFAQLVERAGHDLREVEAHPSETLLPIELSAETVQDGAPPAPPSTLPRSMGEEWLELHGTLGRGGMGIVRLGTQRALGREVAVKTLLPEHRTAANVAKLLQEARVTGYLEHPNVCPVHDVVLDEDGAPTLVLKKIDGVEWSALIHDPEKVRREHGAQDPLEWHIRILQAVCNAVHFAHSRGVVHRDLKPDNVMIGAFGEVYVVDWGIAVCIDDDAPPGLPRASDTRGIAGTPVYMAPEVVEQRPVTARTDVYLLGACLFEAATGRAPHRGENLMQMVSSALSSPPPTPDSLPDDLRRVLHRAMARSPEQRFESAEALRQALDAFLRDRSAERVTQAALSQLAELEAALADEEADEERLRERFGACRFGFKQALAARPEHAAAAEGLRRATHAMVEHALARGEPDAAAAWLSELGRPDPELTARVEDARRRAHEEKAALERVARHYDPERGRAFRLTLGAALTSLFVLAPLALHTLYALELARPTNQHAVLVYVGLLVGWAAVAIRLRRRLLQTAFNRVTFGGVGVALAAPLVITAFDIAAGVPWQSTGRAHLLTWAVICAMLGLSVHPRFLVPTLGFTLGAAALVAWPAHLFLVMAAANALLGATVVLLWRGKRDSRG